MDWIARPTEKDESIDSFISDTLGFDRRGAVSSNTCATCGCDVSLDSFKDELSLKEYHISGMCQKCQDDFFGE